MGFLTPAAELGGKTSVFISHAHQDSAFTTRLTKDLVARGFAARTFKDIVPRSATVGMERLHSALVHALENDSYVLAVLSPDSVNSKLVTAEVYAAIRAEGRKGEVGLLPVLARNCERPEIFELRTPTDFTESYEVGFEDLVARLSAPKKPLPAEPEKDAPFVASESAATTLQQSLSQMQEWLATLSPLQFEQLAAEQFRKHFDLQVTIPSTSRDGGIDIVAFGGKDRHDSPILIQCKRYAPTKQVGVEVVRSLFGAMGRHGPGRMIVTTSHFSKGAAAEAKRLQKVSRDRWSLSLIDSNALVHWLATTPSLGTELTTPLQQQRLRYVTLVDKKYTGGLSLEEEAERTRLATALEDADAPFYNPLKEALTKELDRVVKAKKKQVEES
jgi:Restriction endonuclease/TIR domain